VNETDLDAVATAQRLSELGVVVKSPTLAGVARDVNAFHRAGGNRSMRRAAARANRRKR
jgi:hypothetical protein